MSFWRKIAIVLCLGCGLLQANTIPGKDTMADVCAELQEEIENYSLATTGTIPHWLSGTLIRNGPITVTIEGKRNAHWFDGLAMLHAFSFHHGKVQYSNKFLRSDAFHSVFDQGSLDYEGFAADPCRSVFKKFFSFLIPHNRHAIQNANVNVAHLADAYVALTEVPLPVRFDLQTLETLGVVNFQDALPKEQCWESAHPHIDRQGNAMNYLIEYGRTSYYTIYSIANGLAQRNVIAKVPVAEPAYMHSFALTENYVVLTEFPFVVKPLDLMVKNQPFIKNFTWQPERGTRFLVIDRKKGELVGTFKTKPFFAFHHANAFEKEGRIYLDIVAYTDAHIVMGEDLYNSDKPVRSDHPSQIERFVLTLSSGEITSEVMMARTNDFPRINEKYDGQPYRYLYFARFDDDKVQSRGLGKVDMETKEVKEWEEEGCSPGEPIFVASPVDEEEDGGVILTVVFNKAQGSSFILILDAKTFTEIGRATAPHFIPTGLHGQFFK